MSTNASLPGRTIFGVFFVVCLALFAIVPAGADVRILSSSGGMVEDYLRTFAQIRRSGERVIIDGPCLSACTLVLSTVPKSRICVTRRAVFGFHAAQWVDPRTGLDRQNRRAGLEVRAPRDMVRGVERARRPAEVDSER